MTRQILITAAVVAALASPLTAGDEPVEKATRYRVAPAEAAEPVQLPEAASHDVTNVPVVFEVQTEELGVLVENESSAQIEELGYQCCYIWAQNAEQVEELGGGQFNWNQSAEQVEELGDGMFTWNQSAEQVEELGGQCCYIWAQ